jgi:hypothetical protein
VQEEREVQEAEELQAPRRLGVPSLLRRPQGPREESRALQGEVQARVEDLIFYTPHAYIVQLDF